VKFLAKLGKSATETHSLMMEVYGDECLVIKFSKKKGEIEDDPRPGWPCTSKTDVNIEKSVKLFEKIVA
jgi:hypothetical protein